MKLVSLNIELNKHYDTVLAFLKKENADVVCIQELLEEDVPGFEKELGMPGVFKAFAYCGKHPQFDDILISKREGVGIFSRNIVDSGFIFYMGAEANLLDSYGTFKAQGRVAEENVVFLWADIKSNDETYRVITTHLPVTKEGASTPYQLEVVDALSKELDTMGEFSLCGDMNAPRGYESFTRLAQKYTDNIPVQYTTSIDQNLHRVKGLQYMVDGLFTTPTYRASEVRLQDGVSDHLAIVANITKQ